MNIKSVFAVTIIALALALAGCGDDSGSRAAPVSFDKNGASVKPGDPDVNVKLSFNNFLLGCDQAKTAISLTNTAPFTMNQSNWQCNEDGNGSAHGSVDLDLHANATGGTTQIVFFATSSGDFVNTAPPPKPKKLVANSPFRLLQEIGDPQQQDDIAVGDMFKLYSNYDLSGSTVTLSASSDSNADVVPVNISCVNPTSSTDKAQYYSCQYNLPNSISDYSEYNKAEITYNEGSKVEADATFADGLLAQKDGQIYYQQSKYLGVTASSVWSKIINVHDFVPSGSALTNMAAARVLPSVASSPISSVWTLSENSKNNSVDCYTINSGKVNYSSITAKAANATLYRSSVYAKGMYLLSNTNGNDYTLSLYSDANKVASITLKSSAKYKLVNMLTSTTAADSENVYVLMTANGTTKVLYKFVVANNTITQSSIKNNFLISNNKQFDLRLIHLAALNSIKDTKVDDVAVYESYYTAGNPGDPFADNWHIAVGKPGVALSSYTGRAYFQIPDDGSRPMIYSVSKVSDDDFVYQVEFACSLGVGQPKSPYIMTIDSKSAAQTPFPIFTMPWLDGASDAAYDGISIDNNASHTYWTYNDGKKAAFLQGVLPLVVEGLEFSTPSSGSGSWLLRAV